MKAVKVVEVALAVVAAEDVHPLVVHDGRVRVARRRPAARQLEVEQPHAFSEVEGEQVVAVHAAIVAAKDVERIAVHDGRREDARAGRARGEGHRHPRVERAAIIGGGVGALDGDCAMLSSWSAVGSMIVER